MQDADAQGIAALRSILALERKQGYGDKAVVGGMDRFLEQWASLLTPVIGRLPKYSELSPERRGRWATHVLSRLPAAPQARSKRRPPAPRRAAPLPQLKLRGDVSRVRGVTQSNLPKIRRLGLETVRDLLHHFPIRHNDFADIRQIAELQFGMEQTILAEVAEMSQSTIGSKRSSAHAVLTDSTGGVRATWFNQGYLVNTLRPGTKVFVSGKVSAFRGSLLFENPEYEIMRGQDDLMHTGTPRADLSTRGRTVPENAQENRQARAGRHPSRRSRTTCPKTYSTAPACSACNRPSHRCTTRTPASPRRRHAVGWPSTRCSCSRWPSCAASSSGRRRIPASRSKPISPSCPHSSSHFRSH